VEKFERKSTKKEEVLATQPSGEESDPMPISESEDKWSLPFGLKYSDDSRF
jgi:hypothetical protein